MSDLPTLDYDAVVAIVTWTEVRSGLPIDCAFVTTSLKLAKEYAEKKVPKSAVNIKVETKAGHIKLDPKEREWEYDQDGTKIFKPEAGFGNKTVYEG